jgi:RNA polymerase sigma-70 factor (ECF subfamily)
MSTSTSLVVPSAGVVPLEEEVVGMFDQFRDRLLRYLLSLGLDAHDGEEVVQEAFLALFQHLQRGKSRHNLRSWIFRVAHNLGLKQRKRNLRAQRVSKIGDALAQTHIDPGPNPEEQFLNKDRQRRLRAVLDAMPEKDRWCLNLRAEGLRYREIAEVLGISLGAVSLILGRSLARLGRID